MDQAQSRMYVQHALVRDVPHVRTACEHGPAQPAGDQAMPDKTEDSELI